MLGKNEPRALVPPLAGCDLPKFLILGGAEGWVSNDLLAKNCRIFALTNLPVFRQFKFFRHFCKILSSLAFYEFNTQAIR